MTDAPELRVLLVLAIAVVLFVVLRAFVLWYWKVDELVRLLTNIDARLAQVHPLPEPLTKYQKRAARAAAPEQATASPPGQP